MMTAASGRGQELEPTLYLVYADDGMRLVYSGEDSPALHAACDGLAPGAAGYLSGYQFVGRRRVVLRAYFAAPPSAAFIAGRDRRDLFDLDWHELASGASEGNRC
jgi:hypothetical protein